MAIHPGVEIGETDRAESGEDESRCGSQIRMRDSSACAIASSGLLVLSDLGGKEEFVDAAIKENKLRFVCVRLTNPSIHQPLSFDIYRIPAGVNAV